MNPLCKELIRSAGEGMTVTFEGVLEEGNYRVETRLVREKLANVVNLISMGDFAQRKESEESLARLIAKQRTDLLEALKPV